MLFWRHGEGGWGLELGGEGGERKERKTFVVFTLYEDLTLGYALLLLLLSGLYILGFPPLSGNVQSFRPGEFSRAC